MTAALRPGGLGSGAPAASVDTGILATTADGKPVALGAPACRVEMVGKKQWASSRCSRPSVVVGTPLPPTVAPPTGTPPEDAGSKWAGASTQSGPDFAARLATLERTRGRHVLKWHVYIEKFVKRSNVFVGVQSREASGAKFIGSDSFGWGFILNGALWTNNKKQKSAGRRAQTGDLLTLYLDVASGQLCILQHPKPRDRRGLWVSDLGACERFGLQEEEQARLGVAGREGSTVCGFGLRQHLPQCAIPHGLELAPALSMYDPGDAVQMWMDYEAPPTEAAQAAALECGVGVAPGALAPSGVLYSGRGAAAQSTAVGAAEHADLEDVSEEDAARLAFNASLRAQAKGRKAAIQGEQTAAGLLQAGTSPDEDFDPSRVPAGRRRAAENMQGMGFSLRWCVDALLHTGDQSELAVEWLLQNADTLAARDQERRRRKAAEGDATRMQLDSRWFDVAAVDCRESSRGHFDALQSLVASGAAGDKEAREQLAGAGTGAGTGTGTAGASALGAAPAVREVMEAAAEAAKGKRGMRDVLAQKGPRGWWLAYVRGGDAAKGAGASGEMRVLSADATDHLTSRGRQAVLRWLQNETDLAGVLGDGATFGSESELQRSMLEPWRASSLRGAALRLGSLALGAAAGALRTIDGAAPAAAAVESTARKAAAASAATGALSDAAPASGAGAAPVVGGGRHAAAEARKLAGLPWGGPTTRAVAEMAHRSCDECGASEAARKRGAALGADVLQGRSVGPQLKRATLAVLPAPPVPSAQTTSAAVVAAAALQLTPGVVRPSGDASSGESYFRGYSVSHQRGGPMARQAVCMEKDPLAGELGLDRAAQSAAESEALATAAHARGKNKEGRALELHAMAKGAATHARLLRVQARWLLIRSWATAVGGSAPLLDLSAGSDVSRAMADLSSRDARAMLPPPVRAFLWAEALALTARAREAGSAVSCGARWQNGKQDPKLSVDRRLARLTEDNSKSALQQAKDMLLQVQERRARTMGPDRWHEGLLSGGKAAREAGLAAARRAGGWRELSQPPSGLWPVLAPGASSVQRPSACTHGSEQAALQMLLQRPRDLLDDARRLATCLGRGSVAAQAF